MAGFNRTVPEDDYLDPDRLGVDPPLVRLRETVRSGRTLPPPIVGLTTLGSGMDCELVAKDELRLASPATSAVAALVVAGSAAEVFGADVCAAPPAAPTVAAGAVDDDASGALLADEAAVGLKKTTVSCAVLAGSLTASWATNCVAPSSSADAPLEAPGGVETSPRKMYPRSPAEPTISTNSPVRRSGAVVPRPVTWALNHGSPDEVQAFVVIVTSIELAAAEPNEPSEAEVEKSTTGLTVGNGTAEALAADTAELSPR